MVTGELGKMLDIKQPNGLSGNFRAGGDKPISFHSLIRKRLESLSGFSEQRRRVKNAGKIVE